MTPAELIQCYLEDSLSEAEADALHAWLAADPANVDVFTVQTYMHSQLCEVLGERKVREELLASALDSTEQAAGPQTPIPSNTSDPVFFPRPRFPGRYHEKRRMAKYHDFQRLHNRRVVCHRTGGVGCRGTPRSGCFFPRRGRVSWLRRRNPRIPPLRPQPLSHSLQPLIHARISPLSPGEGQWVRAAGPRPLCPPRPA